jgi:hypothetical protein
LHFHSALIPQSLTPAEGQGEVMKRVIFSALMLSLFAVAMAGCRASGELGDTASISVAR